LKRREPQRGPGLRRLNPRDQGVTAPSGHHPSHYSRNARQLPGAPTVIHHARGGWVGAALPITSDSFASAALRQDYRDVDVDD